MAIDTSGFLEVPGITLKVGDLVVASIYADASVSPPVVRIDGAVLVLDASERIDTRAPVVVVHADKTLKVDCNGEGFRWDAHEVPGEVVRRDWAGEGRGAGYLPHRPEIPLTGPVLPDSGGDGADGGPPWDRFGDS